ncbi:MAG: nucleotidyltransferase family protein [Candidatus Omnitrophica bacterium]|jgi:glucose-1-phosphate thymidylyltransferase|nr:nucleotidyltransferase family protein [Candidatus Omnitrophota bacterium]
MKALILAAGYATRLYPLTKEYPKPLLEVGGQPLINYIVAKLQNIRDIDEIIIVTNSKFILKFKHWAKNVKSKKPLILVDDLSKNYSDRRGAIGDMHFVIRKKRLNDDLLVIGGDNLFDGGLKELVAFARKGKPRTVIGIHDIGKKSLAVNYGVIKLDRSKRIIDFKEKPKVAFSTLVAMCLYYFPKEKLGLIGEYLRAGTNAHDATGFYIDWLRSREDIYGYIYDGRWFDIGEVKFYKRANKHFTK